MKTLLLFSLVLLSFSGFSQTDSNSVSGNKMFKVVEQMPEFPGGQAALMSFIGSNIVYPDSARNNDVQGRVVVGFIVGVDGSLSGISIKKGVSEDIDAEALRVVKLLPKFKPGKEKGIPVAVSFVLPIMFKLSSNSVEINSTSTPPAK